MVTSRLVIEWAIDLDLLCRLDVTMAAGRALTRAHSSGEVSSLLQPDAHRVLCSSLERADFFAVHTDPTISSSRLSLVF